MAECYFRLGRDRASGIDGVTWKAYGEHLDENLSDLISRLKRKRYKPQPSKRVYIPKDKDPSFLLLIKRFLKAGYMEGGVFKVNYFFS